MYSLSIDQSFKDTATKNRHLSTTHSIDVALRRFVETNNIFGQSFVVTGSSCAHYMNYFGLVVFKDVDIFIPDRTNDAAITKTHKIDLLPRCILPEGWEGRMWTKNGFRFFDAFDLTVQEAMGAMYKGSPKHYAYVAELLRYTKLTPTDVCDVLLQTLLSSTSTATPEEVDSVRRAVVSFHARLG